MKRYMNEEQAYALARRVARTPGYSVLEVRRAWSALRAWHVATNEHRTGERILLLNDDQFDARLHIGAGKGTLGENSTAHSTAHTTA